jgi:hypothetical protein
MSVGFETLFRHEEEEQQYPKVTKRASTVYSKMMKTTIDSMKQNKDK